MVSQPDYKVIGVAIMFLLCWIGYFPQPCRSTSVWSVNDPVRTDISVHAANDMINNNTAYPDLLILDVRDQWEYDINHLHDALLIPLSSLTSRLDEIESYIDTEIIVYCRTGARSQQGSDILVANNFTKVFNMLGGITAWIEAGYDYWPNDEELTTPTTQTATTDINPLIIGVIGGAGAVVVIVSILFFVRRR
ncbi:MAG: rhodanese-like domain-containing protein [Candidatus Thorarchaeota archaeon]